MKPWLASLAAAAAWLASPSPVLATDLADCSANPDIAPGERIAVVIANSDYRQPWSRLTSPAADVAALAEVLGATGFTVTTACNLDRPGMDALLDRLAQASRSAQVALVYFAGHGFELGGNGYLVPVDATSPASGDSAVPVERLRAAVGEAAVPLVFLDACRSELGAMEQGTPASLANANLFADFSGAIGFAAAQGQPAYDSAPPGYELSPFAESLVDFLPIRGLELGDVFRAVHNDVERRTRVFLQGSQEPWLLNRLERPYYFSPPIAIELDREPTVAPVAPLDIDLQGLESGDEFGIVTRLLAERGLEDILAVAAAGDPMAEYLVYFMLRFGMAVQPDEDLAENLLQRSAAAGNPAALTVLGHRTMMQAESAEEEDRGRQMLLQAAGQNFARAHYFLGDLEAAARDGDAYSAFLIADKSDLTRGLALLEGMAEAGDDFAENWLCELAMVRGLQETAETSCLLAARAGFRGAQSHYAQIEATRGDLNARKRWATLGRPTIYFEFDSARLTGVNQRIVVSQLVAELQRRPWNGLTLEVHTDQFTSAEYALGYSSRMANLVSSYLMAEGVDASKISTIAYGSSRPNSKSLGVAPLNRRVEIVVDWADGGV